MKAKQLFTFSLFDSKKGRTNIFWLGSIFLSYNFFFCQLVVFFSYIKSTNNTFRFRCQKKPTTNGPIALSQPNRKWASHVQDGPLGLLTQRTAPATPNKHGTLAQIPLLPPLHAPPPLLLPPPPPRVLYRYARLPFFPPCAAVPSTVPWVDARGYLAARRVLGFWIDWLAVGDAGCT